MNRRSPLIISSVAAALLTLTACGGGAEANDPDAPLTFAMPPGTDDPDLLAQVDVVADMVADATGREVETERPADYMAVVESVRSGFVDVAVMSPFSAALAVKNDSVTPIVAWKAETTPASLCLVPADSELEDIGDFAGHQIAFVDPGSATGHFLPRSLLVDNGLVDGEDYTSTFAGSHDSAVLAMLNDSVDMACTAAQLYPTFVEAGMFAESDVRVLAETDPIPIGSVIIVRNDLDETTKQQLIDTLPDAIMANEQTHTIVGGADEYIENPTLDDLAPLLKVAENVGISLEDIR